MPPLETEDDDLPNAGPSHSPLVSGETRKRLPETLDDFPAAALRRRYEEAESESVVEPTESRVEKEEDEIPTEPNADAVRSTESRAGAP